MAGRVYPLNVVNVNTPLMYDGSDFRVPFCDVNADGDWSLRVSLPCDRHAIFNTLGDTEELTAVDVHTYTYTVPASKRAIIMSAHGSFIELPTDVDARVYAYVNFKMIASIIVTATTPLELSAFNCDFQITLLPDDTATIMLINNSSDVIHVVGTLSYLEFDA